MAKPIIAVSGGFDPVHSGHLNMFREASKLGTLVVLLNSDDFLVRKKGRFFMPYEERKSVLESIRYVDHVIPVIDQDQTVCETLKQLKPDVFANAGDRTESNTPETGICEEYGIEMRWGVGGNNGQSSSKLLKEYAN